MTTPDTPAALDLLETIRGKQHPEIAADLLATIYEREHAAQFEEDRGVIQAGLRDLISDHVDEAST